MNKTTQSAVRQLKVNREYRETGKSRGASKQVPSLKLAGEWFRRAGFEIGSKVQVQVNQGELILTLDDEGRKAS